MRAWIAAVAAVLGTAQAGTAQPGGQASAAKYTLDIAGINVAIGEPTEAVLSRFAALKTEYDPATSGYSVTVGSTWVGKFFVKDGHVVQIQKNYFDPDPERGTGMIKLAFDDFKAKSAIDNCALSVEAPEGLPNKVAQFSGFCGRYAFMVTVGTSADAPSAGFGFSATIILTNR